jgi:hypothetical protein
MNKLSLIWLTAVFLFPYCETCKIFITNNCTLKFDAIQVRTERMRLIKTNFSLYCITKNIQLEKKAGLYFMG